MFQAIIVYEMSRLAVFSDTVRFQYIWLALLAKERLTHDLHYDTSCKWWITASGFAEISSMAASDLLLLLRVHALWGKRRSVVAGTYAAYACAYISITIMATITAFEVIPILHYDPLARICTSEFSPRLLPTMWSVSLFCEITVFVMTAIKALEHRTSESSQNPLLQTLYYDQFLYYIIIIVFRIFNLLVLLALPHSLYFLGLFFIWALITTLLSRIMLHLRSVACAHSRPSDTGFFEETVKSTRIVWARQNHALDTSFHSVRPEYGQVSVSSAVWGGGEESQEIMELPQLRAGSERVKDGGVP
ncbi:hypothetical protein M407DRAFT_24006 [Tulasnella calospora MUT 4182]|uniref:Uncharacterized protein n=1 Tax=Tulasnella calospora MUT 4182 TaxID=1051891 RepID=A0A0C3KZ83_9AGAM|nr:hypothetical protein M407DRAFT_24006 [Tulasnella calospora MUT 4182]